MKAKTSGVEHDLMPEHRVGRSPRNELVLDHPGTSSLHALLRWTGEGWELRDLGSRNGTWADGRRLERGESAQLKLGSLIAFARPESTWELSDAGPPLPVAISKASRVRVTGSRDMIALPGEHDPQVSVCRGADGEWQIEAWGQAMPVRSGSELEVAGQKWLLHLPSSAGVTADVDQSSILHDLGMHFRVSPDEEYVELEVSAGQRRIDLGARAHHYLLLTLARLQLEELQLAPSDRGWISAKELQRMLRIDELYLNVQIYRARKQLVDAGLQDGAQILQRRSGTGLIRLMPVTVEVGRI